MLSTAKRKKGMKHWYYIQHAVLLHLRVKLGADSRPSSQCQSHLESSFRQSKGWDLVTWSQSFCTPSFLPLLFLFAQETWPLLLPSLPPCLWRLPPHPSLFSPETGHPAFSFFYPILPILGLVRVTDFFTDFWMPPLGCPPAPGSFNASRLIAAVPFPGSNYSRLVHSP